MQLQHQYRAKGVQFVGIAVDNRKQVADFASCFGINYPVLQAEETGLAMMPLAGNTLGGLPFTFIVNRDGKIVATAPDESLKHAWKLRCNAAETMNAWQPRQK